MMERIALIVGAITMAAGGFLLACALLGALSYATGFVGARVFIRLRRIYHLRVMGYWLDRLEREGSHVFEKATPEKAHHE